MVLPARAAGGPWTARCTGGASIRNAELSGHQRRLVYAHDGAIEVLECDGHDEGTMRTHARKKTTARVVSPAAVASSVAGLRLSPPRLNIGAVARGHDKKGLGSSVASCRIALAKHETRPEIESSLTLSPACADLGLSIERLRASVRRHRSIEHAIWARRSIRPKHRTCRPTPAWWRINGGRSPCTGRAI